MEMENKDTKRTKKLEQNGNGLKAILHLGDNVKLFDSFFDFSL